MALLDDDPTDNTDSTGGFGDVMGGAGNRLVSQFLTPDDRRAAATNALMNIGAALMQAGAPSFDPSHRSLGYALGAGLQAGQQAYQGSLQRGLATAGAAMNLAQNRLFFNLARRMAGGGAAAPAAAGGGAATAGAGGTSAPVTNGSNSATAPSAPGAAAAPAAAASGVDPLNPVGMPGALAGMAMLNPQTRAKFFETQMSAYSPTDYAKTLIAQGIAPGTPAWQAAMGAYQRKLSYIPPTSLRPGGGMYDPNTGQIMTTPAAAPPGFQNVQLANGQWATIPVLDGPGAVKAAAAAQSIGKAYGKTGTGYVNGQPTFVNQGALADATAGNAPLGGAGSIDAALGGGGGVTGVAGVRPSLSPAESEVQQQRGKLSEQARQADLDADAGYTTRNFILSNMVQDFRKTPTGPGQDKINEYESALLGTAPGVAKALGISPDKVAAYEKGAKYATQFAIAQASQLGQGTDAKLATILSGNANGHISNLSNEQIGVANMALNAMNHAIAQEATKQDFSQANYPEWRTKLAGKMNPAVYAWDLMQPAQQQRAYKMMTPAERQDFQRQYAWAKQNGYLPSFVQMGQ